MNFACERLATQFFVDGSWTALLCTLLSLLLSACTDGSGGASAHRATAAQVGARLFNDARLGADGKTACATCHNSRLAFTDARPVSVGAFGRVGTRNAPSLLSLTERGPQFWDGREDSLTAAVMQPFANPKEMGHDSTRAALTRIAAQPEYRAIFGENADEAKVATALAAYLKSLDPAPSRFDRARALGDYASLGIDAQRGMNLFQGKAQCASCHLTFGLRPSFTDGKFHHASVGFERIAGNIRMLRQRAEAERSTGVPIGQTILADQDIAELGRFVVTGRPLDLGAFRTPSLRNVARTAPYMHNGSINTLEAAIEHELYYRGLTTGQPIKLTVEEQRQLAAFLRTLSTP